jgi:hypothetical protein
MSNEDGVSELLTQYVIPYVRSALRICCISLIYLTTFTIFGAGFLKSFAVAAISFVMLTFGAGTRAIQGLAVWMTIFAVAEWTNLLPAKLWFESIIHLITNLLTP